MCKESFSTVLSGFLNSNPRTITPRMFLIVSLYKTADVTYQALLEIGLFDFLVPPQTGEQVLILHNPLTHSTQLNRLILRLCECMSGYGTASRSP